MPIIESKYTASGLFKSGHFSTIYSAKLRPSPLLKQERERIDLPDGDFMDLDWSYTKKKTQKVAILLHGLEGNAQRVYIKGQGKILKKHGWDIVAVNFRGCSGEVNKVYNTYNAGKTEDLDEVIQYILKNKKYTQLDLVGFSLGGNVILKYLGEGRDHPKEIHKGVAISTPVHLKGSLESLDKFYNKVYSTSFLLDLRQKYKVKMQQFPEKMSVADLKKIKSLYDFDNIYTAPANGYKDADEYYAKSSSLQFLPNINIPILILNAKNDTFLSPECYPKDIAERHENIHLEMPKHGGHVGFHINNTEYYSETRTLEFLCEGHKIN